MPIQVSFWSLQSMDFTNSAAQNGTDHYCHIQFTTAQVLSHFPGREGRIENIERISPFCYVVRNGASRLVDRRARGRPPYPWDGFLLEVAAMIQRGDMPAKKEAAIQHFQDWLEKKHGVKPSRAAVGEKLKPYYDRFIRRGQKIIGEFLSFVSCPST